VDVMINYYLQPLKVGLKNSGIAPSDFTKIFSNIEQIHSVNVELMELMEAKLENGISIEKIDQHIVDISKIFSYMVELMKVYAEYCTNNPLAIETLNRVSKIPEFQSYEELTRKSTNKIRLDGFIAKPVQRVLKYPLFFRDLLKKTIPDENCYKTLRKASLDVEMLAKYINEHKNQKENREKLFELERLIRGYKKKNSRSETIFFKRRNVTKEFSKGKISREKFLFV